jgi:hypothetical protein
MNEQNEQAESYVKALERRVEMLEAGLSKLLNSSPVAAAINPAAASAVAARNDLPASRHAEDGRMSRRRLLTGAAVTAAGAGAFLVRSAQPAAAATGGGMILGTANDANAVTSLANTASSTPATLFVVTNSAGIGVSATAGPNFDGISGTSSGGASGAGVAGTSSAGYGLYGDSTSGYAMFAGGNGRIGMNAHVGAGAPIAGTYSKGDIIRDANAALYLCVVAGTPGTWKKVVGPDTSTLHLVTPVRLVDTYAGLGLAAGAFSGARQINLRTGPVPANAVGVMASITAYAPSGTFGSIGSVSIAPAGASAGINTNAWGPDDGLSNGFAISALSSGGVLQVYASSATQLTIDVAGYLA